MQPIILIICFAAMLIAGAASAMFRSQLKSAICLALVSIFLAIVLFVMNLPWAAFFELSVCAGLVTVIFASTISMTTKDRKSDANEAEYHRRFATLPFILIFAGVALLAVVLMTNFDIQALTADPALAATNFKDILWNTRQADILGQIIIILAGAFAVVILFKESVKQ